MMVGKPKPTAERPPPHTDETGSNDPRRQSANERARPVEPFEECRSEDLVGGDGYDDHPIVAKEFSSLIVKEIRLVFARKRFRRTIEGDSMHRNDRDVRDCYSDGGRDDGLWVRDYELRGLDHRSGSRNLSDWSVRL